MDEFKKLPDTIYKKQDRDGSVYYVDPAGKKLNNVPYEHEFEGAHYLLMWPDPPYESDRNTVPYAFLCGKKTDECRGVLDILKRRRIANDFWRAHDFQALREGVTRLSETYVPDPQGDTRMTDEFSEWMLKNTFGETGDNTSKAAEADDNAAKTAEAGDNTSAAAAPAALQPEPWTCPACGYAGNNGKFCIECGTKKPQSEALSDTVPPPQL